MVDVSTVAFTSEPLDRRIALGSGRLACDHSPVALGSVVFVHGNSSCRGVFHAQSSALRAAGWGVTAVDLPGHGASDPARDPSAVYSFPGYARAISQLMDALGLGRTHLVGWSLGGHVALELAASDPRIASVLVTGTPPVRPSPEALADAFSNDPDMALASAERFSREDAERYVGAMLDVPGAPPRDMVEVALSTDGRARRLMVESAVSGVGVDQAAFVASSRLPVAIVQGRRDPFLRMDYLERLGGAGLWRGGVQWLDDLGHAPHWRAPERFNALMFAFLADASRARGA